MSSSISCQMSRETQSPRTFFHEGKRVRIPNDVEFINRVVYVNFSRARDE